MLFEKFITFPIWFCQKKNISKNEKLNPNIDRLTMHFDYMYRIHNK